MATRSSILAGESLWTEEAGRLRRIIVQIFSRRLTVYQIPLEVLLSLLSCNATILCDKAFV